MQSISISNVHKSFGDVHAIDRLNLSIEEGQVCALLGHNGAGKTTTLRLLLGLLEPDSGNVSIFGQNPITAGNTVRGMCGVLSEDVGLYEPLTVYENLLYYTDIYGIPQKEAKRRIEESLHRFGIADKAGLPVKGFSTGMKKKVALIRAMLHRPRLLMLDEPTNGLDPAAMQDLREMLISLAKESGATILMTTHNLDEVQKICDRIIIFRQGRNIFASDLNVLANDKQYMQNGVFSLERLYMLREGGGMR